MFCEKCGAKLPDNAKFCARCGAAMPRGMGVPPVPTMPSHPVLRPPTRPRLPGAPAAPGPRPPRETFGLPKKPPAKPGLGLEAPEEPTPEELAPKPKPWRLIGIGVFVIVIIAAFAAYKYIPESYDKGEEKPIEPLLNVTPTTPEFGSHIKTQIMRAGDYGEVMNVEVYENLTDSLNQRSDTGEDLDPELIAVILSFAINKPGILGDEYIMMLNQAGDIYQLAFESDENVYFVYMVAYKKVKDIYGNIIAEEIGRLSMKRDTYDQISWEGIDIKDLPEISDVEYSGESTYAKITSVQDKWGKFTSAFEKEEDWE